MTDLTEFTYTASIMPCRIYQDASMRTTYSAPLTTEMNAVQALLTQWMMDGAEVEVTVKRINQITGLEQDEPSRKGRVSKR